MFAYKTVKLSEHITQITDPTGVFLFLVQGDREALLVDTGVGFTGLRETVEGLTTLPVTVILTHMHPDHAGGAAAFEKVYVHPDDIPAFREQTLEARMRFASANLGQPAAEEEFLPPVTDAGHFLPMQDGQVFDLGGISTEIIHVPGHTPGSCCVLFREERTILFGDACNCNTLILWEPCISTYRSSLERLATFRPSFEKVFYSHGPAPEGPGRSLEDNLELCGDILERKDDAIPCEFLGMPALRAAAADRFLMRLDGKYGNIVYTEETRR